jgi:triosephosphate isomerase
MGKRGKLIISNWKDYVQTEIQAREILDGVNDYLESLSETTEIPLVFCPKNDLLISVSELLKKSHMAHNAFLGSQDLPDIRVDGLRYVILGHSSRRYDLGETDDVVNRKINRTIEAGLIPIVCIGEKNKDDNADEFIESQIRATFKDLSIDQIGKCIIVYEPVWAITSDLGSDPDDSSSASSRINFINNFLAKNWDLKSESLPMGFYGGSVNSKNVNTFLSNEAFSGVLIGKASSIKMEFLKILSEIVKS